MSIDRGFDESAIREKLVERQRDLERLLEMTARDGSEASERDAEGDVADLGTDLLKREQAMSIHDSVEDRLADTRRALERLDSGAYGLCEACGAPIPPERLEARPEARFCVKHQQEAAKS